MPLRTCEQKALAFKTSPVRCRPAVFFPLNKNFPLITIFFLSTAFFSGCTFLSRPVDIPGRFDPYTKKDDLPPANDFDYASIPDAIPKYELKSKYGNHSPYYILGKYYKVLDSAEGFEEEGIASWYGDKFHGHRTSTMEIFNMYEMSAAHKSLPLPSYARVTNLDNQQTVVVRINDRGPFHDGRVIDLSYAAAHRLGFADKGTARVKVEAITIAGNSNNVAPLPVSEFIQIGAYSSLDKAKEVQKKISLYTTRDIMIEQTPTKPVLYRVRVGPVINSEEMVAIMVKLKKANLGEPVPVHKE